MWSINAEQGYFQLGNPEPSDDLYTMNMTLVNARFFDKLLNDEHRSVVNSLNWSITYDAFGIVIQSDTFNLDDKDAARLTYLGDKSTARIRASTAAFTKFLDETSFSMQIEICHENKIELMGVGWISLDPLVSPGVHEVRQNVPIAPENPDTSISEECRPMLSLVIDVTTSLHFFGTYVKFEEISFPVQNITRSKENLTQVENVNSTTATPTNKNETKKNNVTSTTTNSVWEAHTKGLCDPGEFELDLNFKKFSIKMKQQIFVDWAISFCHPPLGVMPQHQTVLTSKLSPKTEDNVHQFYFEEGHSNENWILCVPKFTQEVLETPLEVFFHKESQAKKPPVASCIIPIGQIFFEKKTDQGRVMRGEIPIYTLPLPGKKVGYVSYKFTLHERTMVRQNVENTIPSTNFTHLSYGNQTGERELKESEKSRLKVSDTYSPRIEASSKEDDRTILKSSNPKVKETSKGTEKAISKADSHSVKETTREIDRLSSKSHNDSETVHNWRVENEKKFKQSLKEKEQSYLQILAVEYKKQKEESEKIIKEKLDEYEALKKECNRKLRSTCDREEAVNKKEKELQDLAHAHSLEHAADVEKFKLENRRLKEEHKIEVASLSKQLEQALAENKTLSGKTRILQEKLSQSEDKYADLLSMRHKWPEAETQRKLDSLEHKCEQLMKEFDVVSKEKQTYKLQAQQLVKELDRKSKESKQRLRDENENLKLQLLASRHQELIGKDLEQLVNVGKEIRVVKDHFDRQNVRVYNSPPVTRNDNINAKSREQDSTPAVSHSLLEAEIEKLMTSREALLKTEAYTPHDFLIKSMESEIESKLQEQRQLRNKK